MISFANLFETFKIFEAYCFVDDNARKYQKRMKKIIKQGPIKINQTGISFLLQKQLHRIAFKIINFSYFFNCSGISELKISFLRHFRHKLILNGSLVLWWTWIYLWETLLMLVCKLISTRCHLGVFVPDVNKNRILKTLSLRKITNFRKGLIKIPWDWTIPNKGFERKCFIKFISYRGNACFDGSCPSISKDYIVVNIHIKS